MTNTIRGTLIALTLVGTVAGSAQAQPIRPLRPRIQERVRGPEVRERLALRRLEMVRARGVRPMRPLGLRANARLGRPNFARQALRERKMERRQAIRSLTPDQLKSLRSYQDDARTQRRAIGDQLRAGSITRDQARQRMQAWREAHKAPSALLRQRRNPGESID